MKKNYKTKVFCGLSTKCSMLFCSILLVTITSAFMSSSVYGQVTKRISLKLDQVSVLDALREINKSGDNVVLFKKEEVERETRKVKVDLRNVTVLEAVKACLENTGLSCVEYEGKVIVTPRKAPTSVTVTGIVRDDTGEPLPGATVVVKGDSLQLGTSANADGEYRLTLPTNVTTLIFSFIGYKTEEVPINGRTRIDVTLNEDIKSMEEVVVNGVFTRKAESYTGSAKTFKAEELKRVGNTNVFQSLKNLDPSLRMLDNFAMGSDPNTLPSMQLRGASTFPQGGEGYSLRSNFVDAPNTPLFILDGFETKMEKVFDMDMNRIESITILKDASAKALYGSKAANGVVVIETKSLRRNETRVTYTGSLKLEMPDLSSYDLCNAVEKLYVENLEGYYDNRNMEIQVDKRKLYNERLKLVQEGLDTYWLSKPLRTGVGQTHTLEIELGEKDLKAYATFAYNDVQGAMKGSSHQTLSGDLNLSYRYKNILFRNVMSVTDRKAKDSPYGTFDTYVALNPYYMPYDEDGKLVKLLADNDYEGQVGNPLYDASLDVRLNNNYLEFMDNFYVEVDFLKDFKAVVRFGISSKKTDGERFYPSQHTKFLDLWTDNTSDEDFLRAGSCEVMNGSSSSLSGDFRVQYNKTLDKHNLYANAQFKLSETKYSEVTHYAEGFPSDRMNDIIFARQYAKEKTPTGSSSINRELSYMGFFSYSYDNRYMTDLTIQANASSLFGNDNRWGVFWSAGVAWNAHYEKFLANLGWIDQLRLRATVGATGNQNFRQNNSIAVYNYVADRYYQKFVGAQLANMENPSLAWEQKMDYTFGLDFKMRNVNLTFDYYIADTKDMAFNRSIVGSTGFNSVTDNLGEVRNRGIEASLTYTVWRNQNGFFNIHGSILTNNNKIRKISDELRAYNERQKEYASYLNRSTPVAMYEDGLPMNTIWAVKSLGIDPSTGYEVFLDRDGNKTSTWSANDLVNCGSSDPKYNGIFGFNGEYKGFGLSATMTFLGGGKYYNQTLVDRVENADIFKNVDRRVFSGRWQTPGQNAQYRRLGRTSSSDSGTTDPLQGENVTETTRATSRFVQKRNEVALSQISAYYDFNSGWVKKIGLKQLRVSAYMNDIATFSTIKIERGTSYPYARNLSFSLSATF